jgi:hypothetical protein
MVQKQQNQRTVHYVGSYPADTCEQAMRAQIEQTPTVRFVSDGETGERANWVIALIESYRNNPAFSLAKDGRWTSYTDCPEFRVADGHSLEAKDFRLNYAAFAMQAWPILERLRQEYNRPDLKLQVGIPHALDLVLFTLGLTGLQDPHNFDVAVQATLGQIRALHAELGDNVVFQIETPASLSVSLLPQDQLPPSLQPEALGKSIADLAAQAPVGAHFGIHLCLGDLGHESRGQLASRQPSVDLANAIAHNWPKGRTLEYIHEPIAAGQHSPLLDKAAYESLADLSLPKDTYYIAGLVHEKATADDQKQVLGWVESFVPAGIKIGIASACGLGRRTTEEAERLTQRMAALAEA